MNKNTKMILGVFAVAAVAVSLGLLLAKSKGKETRKIKKDILGEEGKGFTDDGSKATT
jgi:gas vesicle protein